MTRFLRFSLICLAAFSIAVGVKFLHDEVFAKSPGIERHERIQAQRDALRASLSWPKEDLSDWTDITERVAAYSQAAEAYDKCRADAIFRQKGNSKECSLNTDDFKVEREIIALSTTNPENAVLNSVQEQDYRMIDVGPKTPGFDCREPITVEGFPDDYKPLEFIHFIAPKVYTDARVGDMPKQKHLLLLFWKELSDFAREYNRILYSLDSYPYPGRCRMDND